MNFSVHMKNRCPEWLLPIVFVAVALQLGQAALAEPVSAVSKVTKLASSKAAKHDALAKGISAVQAVELIKRRADVKKFLSLFPQGKSTKLNGLAVVEAEPDEDGSSWTVHVFEQLPDHTATMGWFSVDRKTGAVNTII